MHELSATGLSIVKKRNTKGKKRSINMNLTFLSKTDKELNSMRDWHNSIGKQVRQEIKRRNLCSYSDGTLHRVSKATVETESRVGTVTIVGAK